MDGPEFRQLRKLAGLTQEEAARVLLVSHRTILRWEHGASRIRPLKAYAIRAKLVRRMFGQGEGEA